MSFNNFCLTTTVIFEKLNNDVVSKLLNIYENTCRKFYSAKAMYRQAEIIILAASVPVRERHFPLEL